MFLTFPLQVSQKAVFIARRRLRSEMQYLRKREEKQERKYSSFATVGVTDGQVDVKRARICCPLKINPLSSVVFFGEVQRSEASEAEASTFRVKAADFSVLTFQQVLDPFGSLLLKCGQFLFNLLPGNMMAVILLH